MLVLSRRERERIRLGDSIVVTVVRVSGDRVRIGIEAPGDMVVLRDELTAHPAAESDSVTPCGSNSSTEEVPSDNAPTDNGPSDNATRAARETPVVSVCP